MIPRLMSSDRAVTAAAAYRAALASILGLELDEVPEFEGLAAEIQYGAWLAGERNLVAMQFPSLVPPPGFWLARITSPYVPGQTHTLVMGHAQVVHDPHPEGRAGPGGQEVAITSCELLVPLDPSLAAGGAV